MVKKWIKLSSFELVSRRAFSEEKAASPVINLYDNEWLIMLVSGHQERPPMTRFLINCQSIPSLKGLSNLDPEIDEKSVHVPLEHVYTHTHTCDRNKKKDQQKKFTTMHTQTEKKGRCV